MRERFRVTYDTVSPESAEHGDIAASGYASPGGWKHDDPVSLTLRDAIGVCGFYPNARSAGSGGFENSGSWWTTIDPDQDYRTGEETRYSIHPPENITASSYGRITRYLTGRS